MYKLITGKYLRESNLEHGSFWQLKIEEHHSSQSIKSGICFCKLSCSWSTLTDKLKRLVVENLKQKTDELCSVDSIYLKTHTMGLQAFWAESKNRSTMKVNFAIWYLAKQVVSG